jgi:uncharacterized protein (TIGR02594 family)
MNTAADLVVRRKQWSPYDLLLGLQGLTELAGPTANDPLIMAMLKLDNAWPGGDEVPWCSAAVNFACAMTGVQRTRDLRARSWLLVGVAIRLEQARRGFDVCIFKRAGDNSPATVIDAPGHVAFFVGIDGNYIKVLGGNQGNSVSIARYPIADLLGIRRLE